MVEDFIQIEEIAKENETWLQLNLQDGASWNPEYMKKIEDGFDKIKNNAYFELKITSARTLTDQVERAKKEVAEKKCEEEAIPSFATFFDSFSCHMKCDIEHEFIESALDFLITLGVPMNKELLPLCQKANNLVAEINFDSANELPKDQLTAWGKMMMASFEDIQGGVGMGLMGASIAKEVKVYFLFRDDAYLTLDVNIPGLMEYCQTLGEE